MTRARSTAFQKVTAVRKPGAVRQAAVLRQAVAVQQSVAQQAAVIHVVIPAVAPIAIHVVIHAIVHHVDAVATHFLHIVHKAPIFHGGRLDGKAIFTCVKKMKFTDRSTLRLNTQEHSKGTGLLNFSFAQTV